MAATQPQLYPAPFDAVAASYDETFTFSRIGQAQRNAVWAELASTFHSGDRTLEIGCGTGVDACFLAKRGIRVVACDSSSQMVAVAARRIQENRLQKFVQPLLLRAEDVGALHTSELFDGAFSNFGALNCVEDIGQCASALATLLKPGARALLCWIGPCCLWEMAWYLGKGNSKKAFRRFHRDGIAANVGVGASVRVNYPTLRSLAHTFSPEFRLKSIRGIGIAVPPSYLEPWAKRHTRLLGVSEKVDSLVGKLPGLRMLADHVLIDFERRDTALRSA